MTTAFAQLCICTLSCVLLTTSYGATPKFSSYMGLNTPNKYEYVPIEDLGVNVRKYQTSFVFQVRAKNDAHIALHRYAGNTDRDMYEIVIGGWKNSKSVVRTSKQGTNLVNKNHHPLSDKEFNAFWVSWKNGKISVGYGKTVGSKQFMSWTDTQPRTVNYISVCTGWGASGEWRFNETSKVYVYTPNAYKYQELNAYGVEIQPQQTSFTFEVRAKNDVHVALYTSAGNTNQNVYEIVIGGWGNKRSAIRTRKQGTNLAFPSVGPLSEHELRPFWISWSNGVVRVGTGRRAGVSQFMSWTDPSPHQVNYIGVSTGWGATGKWWIDMQ